MHHDLKYQHSIIRQNKIRELHEHTKKKHNREFTPHGRKGLIQRSCCNWLQEGDRHVSAGGLSIMQPPSTGVSPLGVGA